MTALEQGTTFYYEYIEVRNPSPGRYSNWRVADIATDSRVATCFSEDNAKLVTNALNIAAACKCDTLKLLNVRRVKR